MTAQLAAYFYKAAAHVRRANDGMPAELEIVRIYGNGQTEFVSRVSVDGKVAARKLATQAGAKPWNF